MTVCVCMNIVHIQRAFGNFSLRGGILTNFSMSKQNMQKKQTPPPTILLHSTIFLTDGQSRAVWWSPWVLFGLTLASIINFIHRCYEGFNIVHCASQMNAHMIRERRLPAISFKMHKVLQCPLPVSMDRSAGMPWWMILLKKWIRFRDGMHLYEIH